METALLKEDFQSNDGLMCMVSTYQDTPITLCMVKDEHLRVVGVLGFPISRQLLDSVLPGLSMKEIA